MANQIVTLELLAKEFCFCLRAALGKKKLRMTRRKKRNFRQFFIETKDLVGITDIDAVSARYIRPAAEAIVEKIRDGRIRYCEVPPVAHGVGFECVLFESRHMGVACRVVRAFVLGKVPSQDRTILRFDFRGYA